MLKIAALLFNSIALLLYQFFFTDNVTITPHIPSSAKIGTEFTVEMIIDKGSTSGFAKLQQDLPPGFIAVEGESNGGAFTFINHSVKILWMSLPASSTLKVSYKIKVSAEAMGTHQLTGKFAYASDNLGQTVEISPTTIIINDGSIPPVEVVQKEIPSAEPAEVKETVSSSRKLPENILSTNEFIVEVTINKGDLSNFGKLVETLPAGFTAKEVQSEGAMFSFEDQKVTYIWSSMPAKEQLKIAYKVKMDQSMDGEKVIDGVFSFVQNYQTMKHQVASSIVKVVGSKSTEPVASLAPKKSPVTSTTKKSTPKELSASNIPAAQNDGKMYYKIQVLALKKVKPVENVAAFFKIQEPISLEMGEGYTKYMVGSYEEYSLAHDARDNYITQNGTKGSFITAYIGGKRITIQEALMIGNQKWYK